MTDVRIDSKTGADESEEFRVNAYDLPMGYSGTGTFSAGDVVELHRQEEKGTFANLGADSQLDETERRGTITSTGVYKFVKAATTGACGASTD